MKDDQHLLWVHAADGDSVARQDLWDHLARVGASQTELGSLQECDREDVIQEAYRSLIESVRAKEIRALERFLHLRLKGARSTLARKLRPAPVGLGTSDWEGPALVASNPSSESTLVNLELRGAVDACCSQLGPVERDAVMLRLDEGLKSREIADRLGLCRERLRVLLFRALEKLRTCLERRGVMP